MSDYDFAVYLGGDDHKEMFQKKINLQQELVDVLDTDSVDVVVLNLVKQPELKYSVISAGKLLHDPDGMRVDVEPRILNEFFDFRMSLRRHGLTKA